ncbi:MAG: hypothetical protein Q4C04_08475 [Clostridia bacterium]|nr:hypothetical protein [Clostridia bacterium]
MDISKISLNTEGYAGTFFAQPRIESGLPLPQGRSAKRVLSTSANATVSGAVCFAGGIDVSGSIRLHLVVEAEDSSLFAFDADADFTHRINEASVQPEMSAHLTAQLFSCRCRADEGGLRLNATITLTAVVFEPVAASAISALTGERFLEQKQTELITSRRQLLGAQSQRIHEEARIPQRSALLSISGAPELTLISPLSDGTALEGILHCSALLSDPDGGIFEQHLKFPFSCTVPTESAVDRTATVAVGGLHAAVIDQEQGVLELDAQLSISVYGRQQTSNLILTDAYDCDGSFVCESNSKEGLQYRKTERKKLVLSEQLAVPNHLPEAYVPIYASAQAAITAIHPDEEGLRVDGILQSTAVYRCDSGLLHSFMEELPLSFPLDVSCDLAVPTLQILCVQLQGSGRLLTVDISLLLSADCYDSATISYVDDLLHSEPAEPKKGIFLYFADEGESLFDIGKRFLLPVSVLKQYNPNVKETLSDGEQVLLIK